MLNSVRVRFAVLLAAGAAVLGVTPAYAGTVSFSGTVTDAITGAPVDGACVLLWKEEDWIAYEQEPRSCTGPDG